MYISGADVQLSRAFVEFYCTLIPGLSVIVFKYRAMQFTVPVTLLQNSATTALIHEAA